MLSHLLPQFKLFDGVTVGLLEHLEDALIKRDFGAEQIVFQCDDPPTGFYLVLSGRVKVFRDSPRGQEQILGFFEAGDSFAEAALFQPGYPASAATLVPTELLFVNKNRFLARLAENPELTFKLLIELASKQKRLVTLIEDLTLRDAKGRLCRYFTEQLAETKPGERAEVHLPVPQASLAQLFGITEETLSRSMSSLRKDGVLQPASRGSYLVDIERLNSFCSYR